MPPNEVFVYMGEGGESPPQNVVCVRVDPSVTSIPTNAFYERKKLAEVELCEGLVEIGYRSFGWCDLSIKKLIIPDSLKTINGDAFIKSLCTPIRLHDGIESIGARAFAVCIFTNFKVPPLITWIPHSMLEGCRAMFSVEIPQIVTEIGNYAFAYCYCLRNVAFPPNAILFGDHIFIGTLMGTTIISDLQRLFGSESRIIYALRHRFDGLPIHSIVYYHSHNENVLQKLIAAMNMRSGQSRTLRSKLDPTGNQQDCLGMTPLHIMACTSVHDLEVYRLIVQKYPANLITEDRWGALPLLYAFWGAAPTEIIQFLLESHQSLYPDHVFNWTMMVETMGRTDTPKEIIENLLCVKQMFFPEQSIDWEYLLNKFAQPSRASFNGAPNQERLQFLFMCGMKLSVEALPFKVWRDHITSMIHTAAFVYDGDNTVILREIQDKLAHYDGELPRLKEATSILEIALWKMKIDDNCLKENTTRHQKKIKVDETSFRRKCRITCGADVVIGYVLPYLINTGDDDSFSYESI